MDYLKLISIRRPPSKTYEKCQSRFVAALAKTYFHGESLSITDTLAARKLLYNAKIDSFQHLDIIFATVTFVEFSIVMESSGQADVLSAIKYKTTTVVVWQCDNDNSSSTTLTKTVS